MVGSRPGGLSSRTAVKGQEGALSAADRDRVRALVIPPARQDDWICPGPNGHVQALGDARHRAPPTPLPPGLPGAAGRRQARARTASQDRRGRVVARAVRAVRDYLGNTPAAFRASYIDPRVIELYEDGRTVATVLGDLRKDCL